MFIHTVFLVDCQGHRLSLFVHCQKNIFYKINCKISRFFKVQDYSIVLLCSCTVYQCDKLDNGVINSLKVFSSHSLCENMHALHFEK